MAGARKQAAIYLVIKQERSGPTEMDWISMPPVGSFSTFDAAYDFARDFIARQRSAGYRTGRVVLRSRHGDDVTDMVIGHLG